MIDQEIVLKDRTTLVLKGENRFRCWANLREAGVDPGEFHRSTFLLVGTLRADSGVWASVMYQVSAMTLYAYGRDARESTEASMIGFFIDWIVDEFASELGLLDPDSDDADPAWMLVRWESFSLTRL